MKYDVINLKYNTFIAIDYLYVTSFQDPKLKCRANVFSLSQFRPSTSLYCLWTAEKHCLGKWDWSTGKRVHIHKTHGDFISLLFFVSRLKFVIIMIIIFIVYRFHTGIYNDITRISLDSMVYNFTANLWLQFTVQITCAELFVLLHFYIGTFRCLCCFSMVPLCRAFQVCRSGIF